MVLDSNRNLSSFCKIRTPNLLTCFWPVMPNPSITIEDNLSRSRDVSILKTFFNKNSLHNKLSQSTLLKMFFRVGKVGNPCFRSLINIWVAYIYWKLVINYLNHINRWKFQEIGVGSRQKQTLYWCSCKIISCGHYFEALRRVKIE